MRPFFNFVLRAEIPTLFFLWMKGGTMKKKTITRIHQREILITLDYLLHHTDKDHPAKQADICRYADEKYGIAYQGEGAPGNQITRQRISGCLKYLEELSDKYETPFVLERTEGGKFYVEQRNGLSDEQVARVLAAIHNDPYIGKEDTVFYEEQILNAFATTEDSKEAIKKLSSLYLQGGEKQSKEVIRKIKILEEAYRYNCPIQVQWPGERNPGWTKVCYLKEINHDPYAFLLPACTVASQDGKDHYLFEKIEDIVIPALSAKELFCPDDDLWDECVDNEKMFRLSCPALVKKYDHLDDAIKKMVVPSGKRACAILFYYKDKDEEIISKSFESFFHEKFHWQIVDNTKDCTNLFTGQGYNLDTFRIVRVVGKNRPSNQRFVNFFADIGFFKSWLLSDPIGNGESCIADYVEVMKPACINIEFANYYLKRLSAYYNYLTPRQKDHLFDVNLVLDQVEARKRVSNLCPEDEPLDLLVRCPKCDGEEFIEDENKSCACSSCGTEIYDGRMGFGKLSKDEKE